ncbi:MAG: hypothetical protein R3B57_00755 [Phycisphaerales bacterium]
MEASLRATSRTRCVLAHEPGIDPPRALVEALKRHGVSTVVCDSPFVALARLCEANGHEPDAPVALLLLEPEGMPRAEALREAAERFVPGAACWVYESGTRPRLRAAIGRRPRPPRHERTGQVSPPAPDRRTPPRRQAAPTLRLVDLEPPPSPNQGEEANTGAPVDEGSWKGSRGAGVSRPLLSDDELQMLLSPDPTED